MPFTTHVAKGSTRWVGAVLACVIAMVLVIVASAVWFEALSDRDSTVPVSTAPSAYPAPIPAPRTEHELGRPKAARRTAPTPPPAAPSSSPPEPDGAPSSVPTPWPVDVPEGLLPDAFSAAVRTAFATSEDWHVDVIDCAEYPCVFAISSDHDFEAPPFEAFRAIWEPRFEVYGGADFMVLSPLVSGLPPEASERLGARREALGRRLRSQ